MEYVIDHMHLAWGNPIGRFPPGDSDAEHDGGPVSAHRMRRKSYYARYPGERGAPYTPSTSRRIKTRFVAIHISLL